VVEQAPAPVITLFVGGDEELFSVGRCGACAGGVPGDSRWQTQPPRFVLPTTRKHDSHTQKLGSDNGDLVLKDLAIDFSVTLSNATNAGDAWSEGFSAKVIGDAIGNKVAVVV
jgi:hypothetical protein